MRGMIRFLLACSFLATPAIAAPATTQASSKPSAHHDDHTGDKLVVTHHHLKIGDETIDYEATTGTMAIKDEAGKLRANMFFTAYQREGMADAKSRPITFLFNGGPGAASVWLHLGAVGPKVVALDQAGVPVGPPHKLVDNPQTWLDVSDLVFIDPVNTGYSRAAEGVKPEEFFGVENDVKSVGEFIRLYVTRYQRWASPKYLAGESYGTTRAAALSDHLLDGGIDLNGIIFISSVLDFSTLAGGFSNDLPYVMNVPSYAAIAFHFKKLDGDLMKDRAAALKEVEAWTLNDYEPALAKGDSLDEATRTAIAQKLARYTGLKEDFVERARLRIGADTFRQQLLFRERKYLGRFDARMTAPDPDANASNAGQFPDPSLEAYLPAYTADMQAYVRGNLNFDSDLPYEVLNGRRVQPWTSPDRGFTGGFLNVARDLASAMRRDPKLRVMFCSGYADLATPFFGTDYTLMHMNLPPEAHRNVVRKMYEGGHMLYHVHASLEQLKKDVADFLSVRGD